MEIAHKNTSVDDFVNALKERIEYLDGAVFKKPLKVEIAPHRIYKNYGGACAFIVRRRIFKFLGLKDIYMIFEKNHHTETLSKLEYTATCVAAHEVRHRFQENNTGSLISFDFLINMKYIPSDILEGIHRSNWSRYKTKPELFQREFDASIIEHLIILGYTHQNFSMNTVVELIQCNQETLGDILNQVINPTSKVI